MAGQAATEPLELTYHSDVLCVFAYASEVKVKALKAAHGGSLKIVRRVCDSFGDTAKKIGEGWQEKGGWEAYADHVSEILTLFQKRLENETTRIATLRAISAIARSPLSLDLSAFAVSSGDVLASFLKQYSRNLKQLTLQTLTALVVNPHTELRAPFAAAIITESATLIQESDVHLTNLTLTLLLALLKKDAAVTVPSFCEITLPKLLRFAKSSITHGAAHETLVQVFRTMVSLSSAHPALQFSALFAQLYDPSNGVTGEETKVLSRSSLTNVSKCIAAITTTLPLISLTEGVQRFARDAVAANDTLAQLALLSMGEVGQQADLSMLADLKDVILQCFQHAHEEVKLAAAYAFGHIAVGSMHTFLPLLLQSIASPADPRQQYLLLTALRETIVAFAALHKDFSPYLDTVLPILLSQKETDEDSVRNMIAECIGVLTTMTPDRLIAIIRSDLLAARDNKPVLRLAANAFRAATARPMHNESVGWVIREAMADVLTLLRDDDLDVKKAALMMVNTTAHHNVALLSSLIPTDVFPELLATLQVKIERVIDLGPFKHKVDDNLPLRKLSLAALETLLAMAPDKFDANALMAIAEKLLVDNEEVRLLFIQLLPRVAKHTTGAVAVKIDVIFPALEKLLSSAASTASSASAAASGGATTAAGGAASADAGSGTTKTVIDHRMLLKVILQLDKFEEIRSISRRWCDFVSKLRAASNFAEAFRQLESENVDAF